MDEYRRLLKFRRKRGQHCIIVYEPSNKGYAAHYGFGITYGGTQKYGSGGTLCGCGTRSKPPLKYQRRLVRRALKRDLEERKKDYHNGRVNSTSVPGMAVP